MEDIIYFKTKLLILLSKQQGELLSNNLNFKMISDYQELIKILEEVNSFPKENIFKFLYSYEKNINQILYDYDETIKVDNFKLKNEFDEYYYFDLLIMDEEEIVNYEFNFDLINNNYKIVKNDNNKYKIVIISKILLDITNNFCSTDNYDEEIYGTQIAEIKNELNSNIKNNIYCFDELNIDINENKIKNTKLDDLYLEIIISLINSNKFNDFNYIYNILNQMEIEKIDIAETLLPSLTEVLNEENNNIKSYIIEKEEDLYKEQIINFYFILFKYILKKIIYLYQIPLLIKIRKQILNIIKSKKISYNKLNKEMQDRLKYVLETFVDSDYYLQSNIKEILMKLNEVLNYYQYYYFESKKEDIQKIQEDIKNKNINSEYLKYYEEAVKKNNIYPLIKYVYFTSKNADITETSLKNKLKDWENVYTSIKNCKIKRIKNKDSIYKYFNDKNNHGVLLKIFTQEQIDFLISNINVKKQEMQKEKEKEKEEEKAEKEIEKKKEKDEPTEEGNKNGDPNESKEAAPVPVPNPESFNQNMICNKNNPQEKIKQDNKNQMNELSTKDKTYESIQYDKNGKPIQKKSYFNFNPELSKISERIFEKLCLEISYKDYKINYENITFGVNNIKLPVEKFEQFISNISYLKKEELKPDDKIMLNNLIKLLDFFEELKFRIKIEYQGEEPLTFEINLAYNTNNDNYNNIFNIEALYRFNDIKNRNITTYIDKNILINGTNSLEQGFSYMILYINSKRKKKDNSLLYIKQNNNLKKEERKEQNEGSENNKEDENKVSSFLEVPKINKKASEMAILEIIKIIENKCSYNGFIKELSNGYFAYIKSDNYLVIIDSDFNPIMDINEYGERIINICDMLPVVDNNSNNNSLNNSSNNAINVSNEKEKDINNSQSMDTKTSSKIYKNGNNENVDEKLNKKEKESVKNINSVSTKDKSENKGKTDEKNNKKDTKKGPDLQIALCGNKELYLTSLYLELLEQSTERYPISNIFGFSAIEMKKNNYVVVGKKGISYLVNLFTSTTSENVIIQEKVAYFNSIRINDNMIALVSNSIYPEGQDILNFLNLKKKKLYQNEVKGYSFILSPNGLELISESIKSDKYLLCACKKYSNSQKNGILLVNCQIAPNTTAEKEKFIDTDNFEVHCFCPILNVIDNEDSKEAKIEQTNFLLVGGFDNDLREGVIRLYKIYYGDKASITDIEYLQDIPFKEKENIDEFNGPVNCLIQSKKTGNILASCYNGNIYLLTPPNINYYLKT